MTSLQTYINDQSNNFAQRLKLSENTFQSLLAKFDDFSLLIDHVRSTRSPMAISNKAQLIKIEDQNTISHIGALNDDYDDKYDHRQRSLYTMDNFVDLETKITPFEIVNMVKSDLEKHRITMTDFSMHVLGILLSLLLTRGRLVDAE
jgi:hypothetical protein